MILIVIGIAMWANPFLLLGVWVRRLKAAHDAGIRTQIGWLSLVLASIGCLVFFAGMGFSGKVATPAFDIWFYWWFRVCLFISVAALLTGLSGKGKLQWLVAVSSVITPLSCILQKVLE